jgi:hypothetical protein
MAQVIKIKRSTSAAAPSGALAQGELAYSYNSNKLFIGDGTNNDIIGGQLYTDMLDHTAGQLTANSALIVDANSKLNNLLVDNLQLNGNTVSSASGNLVLSSATGSISVAGAATELLILDNSSTAFTITEGSTNYLTFDTTNSAEKVVFNKQIAVGTEYTLPTTDGTNGQALVTDGSGAVTFTDVAATLTVDGDSTTADVELLTDDLRIVGGTGLDTTASKSGTDVTLSVAIQNGGVDTTQLAADAVTGAKIADNAINSEHYVDGSIDDAHIATGTIANNKLANSSITIGSDSISLGGSRTDLNGITSLDVDNLTLDGNEITSTNTNGNISLNPNGSGVVDVNNSRISNVTDPTQAQDAATKAYVDAVKQALDIKDSVRVATTGNITIASDLNVGDTIDGVTLADGDRVLVKNQTSQGENGIYTAGATPARAADANTASELTGGTFVFVEEGTANGDNGYVFTHNGTPETFGTTAMPVVQFSGAGQVVAGDALSKSGNTINVNDDNVTLEVSSDTVRIKGISATAKGDIILGAATNGGYTRHTKPSSSATTNSYLLSMDTSGNAVWGDVIDGGSF